MEDEIQPLFWHEQPDGELHADTGVGKAVIRLARVGARMWQGYLDGDFLIAIDGKMQCVKAIEQAVAIRLASRVHNEDEFGGTVQPAAD